MTRKLRIKSSTGFYHALLRATSDLNLFCDQEDYDFYVDQLNKVFVHPSIDAPGPRLYAYSLHPTHLHLLLSDGSLTQHPPCSTEGVPEGRRGSVSVSGSSISTLIKRLCISYSYYYNVKYNHYGSIYLDRFSSEPIESLPYYIKVLAHIGGLQSDCKAILGNILPTLPAAPPAGVVEGPVIDYKERPLRITQSRLEEYLKTKHHFTDKDTFLSMPRADQWVVLHEASMVGASVRQLMDITGVSLRQIMNARAKK